MNLLFQAAQQARLIRERQELIFWTTAGPTTTFDPKITGVAGTWFFDDGTTLDAASGVEISKTFAADGLHRAVFRAASGGLVAITVMVCNSDAITAIHSLRRLPNLSILAPHTNPSLSVNLADVPNATSINLSGGTLAMGNINSLNRRLTYFAGTTSPGLYGCVSDFPVTVETIVVSLSTGVLAGSISHLVALRDAQANSVGWLTADVDTVLKSIPDSSYATPVLQIGGTNQAPSGAAWQEPADPLDPESWTGLEAIWMANHKANPWTITFNGGVSEDSLLGNVIGTGEKTWDQTNTVQYLYMAKFVAVAGTIGDIRVRSLGSANVKVAIYDDDGVGGVPGALLAYSTGVAVVAGWNTIQLNVPVPLTAGNYYLAVKTDTSGRIQRVSSGGTSCHNTSVLYADDFTNPAPAMTNGSYDIAIAGWGLKVV